MSGELPKQLGNLSKLRILSLWGNWFTGSIPDEFGQLTSLEELSIFGNQFEGEIPVGLASLQNLRELSVCGNNLSGCVADNLKDIQHTDLDRVGLPSCGERNALAAIFNAIGGENWTNNTNWLSDNGLAGEISADIGDLPNLERVSFFSNQLDGEIPAEFGGLSKLQRMFMGGNRFSGCIPEGLPQAPNSDLAAIGLPECSSAGSGSAAEAETLALAVFSNSPDEIGVTWSHGFEDVGDMRSIGTAT